MIKVFKKDEVTEITPTQVKEKFPGVSKKNIEQIEVTGDKIIVTSKSGITSYQNIHGTYGFPTSLK